MSCQVLQRGPVAGVAVVHLIEGAESVRKGQQGENLRSCWIDGANLIAGKWRGRFSRGPKTNPFPAQGGVQP